MAPFKSICIAALTTLLVVAAGVTAHQLYEQHLIRLRPDLQGGHAGNLR
jgi:hypothetical protein